MKVGFIGLGKMGSRIVRRLVSSGIDVVVWNRTGEVIASFERDLTHEEKSHFSSVELLEDLRKLPKQRIIWSMLPAGEATENALKTIFAFAEAGDIIIDAGNAYFKDTQLRYEECQKVGIRFLGIGVSGGIHAQINGYAMMIGGNKEAYQTLKPIFDILAKPHANYSYIGEGGAGHFVKMVHNAIEYGMMQAIGEGFSILEKSEYHIDLVQTAKLWQKGTIISSFLIDRAYDALSKDPALTQLIGKINATGEAHWAIEEAKKEDIAVPVIEDSVKFREQSQTDERIQHSLTAKMIAALRHEFGGHAVERK